VKKEVRVLTTIAAEKTRGIICLNFNADGSVSVESSCLENDSDYDEINARLTVDAVTSEYEGLLTQLSQWYNLFVNPNGKKLTDKLRGL
jgi:hypothetical protein